MPSTLLFEEPAGAGFEIDPLDWLAWETERMIAESKHGAASLRRDIEADGIFRVWLDVPDIPMI